MWLSVLAELPADITVVLPDLPGLGATSLDQFGDPSLEMVADALAATLTDIGIERAVIGGLSMGGYVALAFADRHPERVAGLALVDTKSPADNEAAIAGRLAVADQAESAGTVDAVRAMPSVMLGVTTRATKPALIAEVDGWIDDQHADGVAWSQRAMAIRPDRTDAIARVGAPVVVIVGDEDTMSPLAAAEHMAQAVVGERNRPVVIPESGHLSAVENPAAVAAALTGLLAKL